MLVNVPALDVQQAGLQSINIGQVALGPITIGDLAIDNANLAMSTAQIALQNVHVTIRIHVTLEWAIHIGMPDWIPDINIGDTVDLGTITAGPMAVGDIVVPGVNNIQLNIPALLAQNASVSADPLSLSLQNATADQVHAANVTLPAAGFTLAGLMLNSVQGNNLSVPAAEVGQASIGHLHGDAITIPVLTLHNLNLAAAQIPSVTSSAPLDIPADLSTVNVGFDASVLKVVLHFTPSALSNVDHLTISNANASATVGQIVLHNVTLPYDVLNLTLSQIGINTISVPAFSVA